MNLRAYYKEVARSLIKDGAAGMTEEEIIQKLLTEPDNPFRPLSEVEIIKRLEASERQYKEGKYMTLNEAFDMLNKRKDD